MDVPCRVFSVKARRPDTALRSGFQLNGKPFNSRQIHSEHIVFAFTQTSSRNGQKFLRPIANSHKNDVLKSIFFHRVRLVRPAHSLTWLDVRWSIGKVIGIIRRRCRRRPSSIIIITFLRKLKYPLSHRWSALSLNTEQQQQQPAQVFANTTVFFASTSNRNPMGFANLSIADRIFCTIFCTNTCVCLT